MLNIVLFGPPGAGKGTQSEKLISAYQLVHLSTGDILRGEIAAGTELGMEAKKLMDAGILVPDEVVIGMIRSKLEQNTDAKGFIFDGFPRTAAQAEALDNLLKEKGTGISMMLALEVSDEELTKRLLLRGEMSGRPDDRDEEVIRKRISEYNNKTAPLKDYYMAQNKYRAVHGIGSIDEIYEGLCNAINFSQSEKIPKPAENGVVAKVVDMVKKVFTKNDEAPSMPAKEKVRKAAPDKVKTAAKPAAKKVVKPAAKAQVKPAAKKAIAKKKIKTAASTVRPAAKKVANKKATAKKITAKKTAAKKTIKKVAAKKTSVKKVVKKVAAKKLALKKVAKKVTRKVAKKVAPKKIVKKAAKKINAKKVVKKITKKVVSKKPLKKTAAKKVAKKVTPKKAAKKGGKKRR